MSNQLNFLVEKMEIAEREASMIPVAKGEQELHLEVKQIIEALLFSSAEPLPTPLLRDLVSLSYPLPLDTIEKALVALAEDYTHTKRAFCLEKLPTGYLLRTREEYNSYLQRLHFGRRGEKLSRASLEVLAIIAYKQPMSRPAIEALRGVDSSAILATLVERGLVETVGRCDTPGRPALYGTTPKFLKHFGLRSIAELPKLEKA
ncbi:MAG: SMC-Scp complex subunit ScpB [Verrucomicrobia bacterium]|nr:SMC-Scp complex subunit ScpB [Verrucomicrobiota bacterium]